MHGSLIFDNSGARRHSSSLQTRRRRPARNAIPRAEPHRAIWGPRTRATHNNVPHERQGDPKDERIYFPFFAPSSACREWYITRGKCCKNWMEVPHKKAKHADLTPSVCVIKYRKKWVVKMPRCGARPQIQHANLANFEFLVRRTAAKWWWVRSVFHSSGNSNCSVECATEGHVGFCSLPVRSRCDWRWRANYGNEICWLDGYMADGTPTTQFQIMAQPTAYHQFEWGWKENIFSVLFESPSKRIEIWYLIWIYMS
jgi:hypothetical protein